jgi:hypothetical protein
VLEEEDVESGAPPLFPLPLFDSDELTLCMVRIAKCLQSIKLKFAGISVGGTTQ